MRNRIGVTAGAVCALLLAGCVSGGEVVPAAEGVAGVVTGSQVSSPSDAAPLGVVQGGVLGADIGQSLDAEDRRLAGRAEYEGLEFMRAGRPAIWRNAESGNSGTVVAGPLYQVNLLDCREYTHTVAIAGRNRVARGTACRRPDGDWRMVS